MLKQCHPVFGARVATIIGLMEALSFKPRIQQAYRSADQQAEALKSKHSSVAFSFHMATAADGTPEALAVDLLEDSAPLHPPMAYLTRLAAIAAQHTCRTGILWGLAPGPRERMQDAITSGRWGYVGPIGWDACHVEVADVMLLEAKAGKRPL